MKNHTLITLLALSALYACERRTLEDDYSLSTLVPIKIDWSLSGIEVEKMHRATIMLFPKNGDKPIEYHLEGNLTQREIAIPIGVYSVIVFNETTARDDWENIVFTGADSYETFAAISVEASKIGLYNRTEDLPLIFNPEAIAAWSLDHLDVTPDEATPPLTEIKPTPRFEQVEITAYVTNLASAIQATGTITNLASGVFMASGEKITSPSSQAFILNGRIYDQNEKDGTTTRTFNIFGLNPTTQQINLDFLLTDGTMHPQETFDATNLIITTTDEIIVTHKITLGNASLPNDHPITLPDTEMKAGITVDQWNEITIIVN